VPARGSACPTCSKSVAGQGADGQAQLWRTLPDGSDYPMRGRDWQRVYVARLASDRARNGWSWLLTARPGLEPSPGSGHAVSSAGG
jgi:hypothetical protein